MPISNKFFFY